MSLYKKPSSGIMISLASPESILERSYGEVTQPETINYRTHKPEMKGLFCERIFGPVKDWECHCGKYKGIRYKGIICDRCGVEVTEKKTRRERTGHIVLPIPVVHIWHFRALPNKMSYLLGLSAKHLEYIIYYERYIVIQAGVKEVDGIRKMDILTEEEYFDILESLPVENQLLPDHDPNKFIANMGAEALEMLLKQLDLDQLAIDLRARLISDHSQQGRLEIIKRLKIVEGFREGGRRIENRPEWMIIRILPVIPPGLRPLFPLGGGKFATSDSNELYRACLIRCNRYNRLKACDAPEIILRHECRMIQEICDALIDNSRRTNTATSSEGVRKLKSFSDALKGKQGRFRQNLLGKRVDYSGRSVIVVGPELLLHECGLPKDMALELFTPFVIRRLIERGIAATVKIAKKNIEEKDPVIWDILENVLKGHPILLNRAPTLHRLSIQAFQPKLIEGKAIQLHPLVCTAFNADFDGDQMAVHVPLSQEAIVEVSLLMLAPYNILNPSNGIPIMMPSRDIILGLFYITKGCRSTPTSPVVGEGMYFYSPQDLLIALDHGKVSIHAHVKVKIQEMNEEKLMVEKMIDTVVGRVIFNQVCPKGMPFINETITSKKLQIIVYQVYSKFDTVGTAQFLDAVKTLGFQSAFKGGMTIGLDDITIPDEKQVLIKQADEEVDTIWDNYMMGLITDNERYNQVIDVWTRTNTRITSLLIEQLEQDQNGFNSIYMMMQSGARGSREQVRQLGGMRGLIARPQKNVQGSVGEIIENPITSNFQEGLNVIEYFISTHGARKGLADTALKTADAGYLTRRLVDVAQDVTVSAEDCGTLKGILIKASKNEERIIESLEERILGRVSVHDIFHPSTNELLVKANEEIGKEVAAKIDAVGIEEVRVRALLTCELHRGVCIKCYGRSLSSGKMVALGEVVGVIAAQSIGEPGTQLTLRTFHVGGTASNVVVDAKVKSKCSGIVNFDSLYTLKSVDKSGKKVDIVMGRSSEIKIMDPNTQKVLMSSHLPYGAMLKVKAQEAVVKDQELYHWDPYNAVIFAIQSGLVRFQDMEEGITFQEQYDEQTGRKCKVIIESKDRTKNPSIVLETSSGNDVSYNIPVKAQLMVEEGDRVQSGYVLAKIPRIVSQSRDITGGLPRVIELFEARSSDNPAIMSDINGIVTYGSVKRGYREIIVESKLGVQRKYMIPLSRHIIVQDHDYVEVGDLLTDGEIAVVDILTIQGPTVAQEYIMNELQEVYRLQGVKIHNKHIEIIIRQMMRKVDVIAPGDTTLLPGQIVDKMLFFKENDKIYDKKVVIHAGDSQLMKVGQFVNERRLKEENEKLKRQGLKMVEVRDVVLAIGQVKLQGITQSSLGTKSFISAASFQETAKVLSEAAISAKYDQLKGLKENVIVGRLIPAGTGVKQYEKVIVNSKKEYEELVGSQ